MEDLLKFWEHNTTNGKEEKIVSNKLKPKTLTPIYLKQSSVNNKIQSKNITPKVNKVNSKPTVSRLKLRRNINVEEQNRGAPDQKKISRPCRSDTKQKTGKVDESKPCIGEQTKNIKSDDELYKNLLTCDTMPDSDSLESDFDEEKGFTAADRFLMLNQLTKELESRENILKDVKTREHDMVKREKSKRETDKLTSYDEEVNEIIKEHFKDIDNQKFSKTIPKKMESLKKVTETLVKETSKESDDSDYDENLGPQVQKLMESLDKKINDYNIRTNEFEKYFDPLEGVTDQKLHNYLLKEVMIDKGKKHAKVAIEDKPSEADAGERGIDHTIDVLHPLSSEEKRQKLKKLVSDLDSKSFLQEKSLKTLSAKENLADKLMVPILDEVDTMKSSKEYDEEFRIMLSDVSTSEEEGEYKEGDKEVNKEDETQQKLEKKKTIKKQVSLKETFGTVMKHMKDNTKPGAGKKTAMQRLLTRYKHKQEEEAHRRREFERWFGGTATTDLKQQEGIEIPGWKPGWQRLAAHLKDATLKDGGDGKVRLKKGHEKDPVEEYKRLVKEYEHLVGKDRLTEGKKDKQSGESDDKQGEKWIKIKKGTLMRDYQVRWRQGMYYLVERKHIKNKTKQTLSKKRMIRANTNKKKGTKQLVNKKTGKIDVKRYIGKKKGTKIIEVQTKPFRKRGDAGKEIKKILSHLERKNLVADDENLMDENKKKLKTWTRAKFINYFKKKLGLHGCDAEQSDDTRESFRKYALLYFDKKLELKESQQKKQQEEMYPLGLFKPNKVNDDLDIGLDNEDGGFNEDSEEEACSDEGEIFKEALANEIFSYWAATDLKKKSELNEPETTTFVSGLGGLGTEIFKQACAGGKFKFTREHFKKRRKGDIVNSDAEQIAQSCSDLYDLPTDLRDRFFGPKSTVSKDKLILPFRDKYVTQDKSYLTDLSSDTSSKIHSDIVSEMEQEGLIKRVNYDYLNDEEAIFPWDEIEAELFMYSYHNYEKETEDSLRQFKSEKKLLQPTLYDDKSY